MFLLIEKKEKINILLQTLFCGIVIAYKVFNEIKNAKMKKEK